MRAFLIVSILLITSTSQALCLFKCGNKKSRLENSTTDKEIVKAIRARADKDAFDECLQTNESEGLTPDQADHWCTNWSKTISYDQLVEKHLLEYLAD